MSLITFASIFKNIKIHKQGESCYMIKTRVASLFSGIGGFEAGLNNSKMNIEVVFASEIDENARISYQTNFDAKELRGDITKIDEFSIPDHDMLVAGFPCQSFSIAGKQGGFDDTRGTLFFDVCRIIKAKKPKIVLLENVKNLISHDKSKTIRTILLHLSELGYFIDFDILNSCDFSVPQNRERTYIIAFNRDIYNIINEEYNLNSNSKKINELKSELNKSNYPSCNFFDNVKKSQISTSIQDIIDLSVKNQRYMIDNARVQEFLNTEIKDYSSKSNSILKLFDLPKEVWKDLDRQRRVYSIMGISPTVLARSDSTKIYLESNGTKCIRKFTPEENFRAMGFDQKFINNIMSSGMSNTSLYKQSGNAVTPPVITAIADEIVDYVSKFDYKTSCNKDADNYTFIDLFSGLGGFRIAFENEGMKCLFSSDIDNAVRQVYFENFKEYPFGDITKLNPSELPDFDVLCAGFPCQPFSLAGKRLGFEDTRGTLFFDVARIAKEKSPKFLLLENVAGLANHDSGRTLETILNTIESIGYHCEYSIMNAYDYGVPQNRKRWYAVCIRNDIKNSMNNLGITFEFPEKKELEYTMNDIIDVNVTDDYAISDICKQNINKFLDDYKNSIRYKKDNYIIATEIRPSRCNFRSDNISPCLTAKMGTGGNNIPVLVEYNRKLSEKECLRIMGFPNWYAIPANKMQSYKQIGNSVVVPVIQMFAKEIKHVLKELDVNE